MIDTLPGHDFCSLTPPMANDIQYITPDILRTELEAQDKRFEAKFDRFRTEVLEAIAAFARGIEESMRSKFAALDDKYGELPERVTKLEELAPRVEHIERTLFAPKPPRKRRASGGRRRRA